MEQIKKYFLLLFFVPFVFSCGTLTKNGAVSRGSIKLSGSPPKKDGLIGVNGYYNFSNPNNFYHYIFFEDGTFSRFHLGSGISEEEVTADKFPQVIYGWNADKPDAWTDAAGNDWGVYSITGDTIKVEIYERGGLLYPWKLTEFRFHIVDYNTIIQIYRKERYPSSPSDEKYYEKYSPWESDGGQWSFHPANGNFSSSYSWLKRQRWIWRDEADWKRYMEKVRLRKE